MIIAPPLVYILYLDISQLNDLAENILSFFDILKLSSFSLVVGLEHDSVPGIIN